MKKFLRTIDDENRYQKDNIKNSLYEKAKFDVDNKLKNFLVKIWKSILIMNLILKSMIFIIKLSKMYLKLLLEII